MERAIDWVIRKPGRVYAVVVVLVSLLVAPFFYSAESLRQQSEGRTASELRQVANLGASMLRDHLDQSIMFLRAIALRGSVVDGVQRREPKEMGMALQAAYEVSAVFRYVGLYDKSGTNLATYPPTATPGQNASGRDWYKGIAAHWEPYVSEVYTVPLPAWTPIFSVVVPVRDGHGTPIGVLLGALPFDMIGRWMGQISAPAGPYERDTTSTVLWRMTAFDKNGTTYAGPEKLTGYEPVREAIQNGKSGVGWYSRGAEEIYAAYAPVAGYAWGVLVEMPAPVVRQNYLAIRQQVAAGSFVAIMAAVLSAGLLILFYQRLIAAKTEAESAVASQSELMDSNLQQVQKFEVLGALTGGIAHDFNNIVTAILGYTSLVLEDVRADTTLHRNLTEIHKAGERAVSLISQLMMFSRKRPPTLQVIDMQMVIMELQRMIGRLIGENIQLLIRVEPNVWNIEADQAQIEQILVNLVVNARDAMPKGGTLTIALANVSVGPGQVANLSPSDYVKLTVEDTGTGISAADMPHIFEAFFTTKGPGRGTGLGLATVAGIVERLRGAIEVESEAGRGAKFTVYIPRGIKGLAVVPPIYRKMAKGDETILVVEDEGPVRKMLLNTLESLGYTVVTASTGEQGIEVAASVRDIDLVLSDVVMPGMSVGDMMARIRQAHPDVKVCLISGHLDEAITDLLIPGAQVLSKPFSLLEISVKIREILDSKE